MAERRGLGVVLPLLDSETVCVSSVHASALTRRRARNLSEAARAALVRPPVAAETDTALRTMIVGLDPLRVLLFGSGPLIGYGVSSREDAIDGSLARLLAEQTNRGIVVETRVRLGLPTEDAVASLGGAGTATFSAAVWAPRFSEELRHTTIQRYRASIHTMLRQFRAQSDAPLVLCHLPVPLGDDWRSTMRRPRVASYNTVLAEEAAAVPGVSSVAVGAYAPTDPLSTPASWHHAQAGRLAAALLDVIRPAARVK